MPTILRSGPYRFFFYSGDAGEPHHIHVERDDKIAKYWLAPVRLQESGGFGPVEIRRVAAIVEENSAEFLRMSTSPVETRRACALRVDVGENVLSVDLVDGRTISVPIHWFPRLVAASPLERANFRLIGRGEGIHWPDVEEDISVDSLLLGSPSREPQSSIERWLKSRRTAS